MRALALLLVLLAPALAACSDDAAPAPSQAESVAHEEEQALAAWRSAVEEELGSATFDFDAVQQDAAVDCLRTDAGAWAVELALSGDVATSGLTRVGLEHACPEVVPAFEEAITTVTGADDPLDLVCGRGVELSAEHELQADLVCANR